MHTNNSNICAYPQFAYFLMNESMETQGTLLMHTVMECLRKQQTQTVSHSKVYALVTGLRDESASTHVSCEETNLLSGASSQRPSWLRTEEMFDHQSLECCLDRQLSY